ncbi:MAG: hypothetical protein M1834_006308 [Cirrosporium novae-zelandiae]|nr:MAG: hypothetical protein M1834_006308 [Cirrosporium novae-zelandiae]
MPRVAHPRSEAIASSKQKMTATPHKQTPIKIPLNDDQQEKAKRLQSRQALHDRQINQLKAAASPRRRLNSHSRAGSTSPETPRGGPSNGNENDFEGGLSVMGSAVTPMKRVPILANFEEWMKMATDNKINAANSWNFALIDYFHDMSLLKEGDGVNFQKASCTLDGCVKIYTSRVDSVATDTGKLLSGLADSGNKRAREEDRDVGEDDEDGEEGEDGTQKKRKKAQRSSEATLAPSFGALQLKKFELEFSVDPLFKKASADFDEGGAKGLLLNHLAIDGKGRIVFDSSDDAVDTSAEKDLTRRKSEAITEDEELQEPQEPSAVPVGEEDEEAEDGSKSEEQPDIDLSALADVFFPDLSRLEDQDICPSLKNLEIGDASGSLDVPFLKAPEDWRQDKANENGTGIGDQTGIMLDDDNAAGFDDDDGFSGGFDLPADTAFGEGGEAWAKEAAMEPQLRVHDAGFGDGDQDAGNDGDDLGVGGFDSKDDAYTVSLNHERNQASHDDILSYFDNALQKNWAGPEHWRIRRIKDSAKPSTTPASKPRKEKEPFEIDFMSPMTQAMADTIYLSASSNSAITLPKTQWKSKTRNLLPDDKHFNSRQLLRLFLKPKARMGSRRFARKTGFQTNPKRPDDIPEGEIDENFWANNGAPNPVDGETGLDDGGQQGNYDANFFADDPLAFPGGLPSDVDDDEFADARDHFSPPPEGGMGDNNPNGIDAMLANGGSQEPVGPFGSQLVTQSRRLRPEYVQYARVAKKVDVRRLKEELWRGTGYEELMKPPLLSPSATPAKQPEPNPDQKPLKFTSLINSLQRVYPPQTMADISTSYCFICLLHLANEKGLTIEKEEGLQELTIWRDPGAEIHGEGE